MKTPLLTAELLSHLHAGTVIPAHPLALNSGRQLDEARQRQLTRYYLACGVGGIAVGVHTTQFEIRLPKYNLFETVLRLAAEEIAAANLKRPFLQISGICGNTDQAVREASLATAAGYQLGLLSMGGLDGYSEEALLEHTRAVADHIPVFGFYLQPAVGGRVLSYQFWRRFAEIDNVHAIKIAAFNRYQTLDTVRGICESSRCDSIALYTGNDDNIVADLLTPYRFPVNGSVVEKRFSGGLLGHWAIWTSKAVALLKEIHSSQTDATQNISALLSKGIAITDINAAFFDPASNFHGCIAGIHEVLRRQGLLEGRWCLNANEALSPGQLEEIDRVYTAYPDLNDDGFVREFLATTNLK